MNPYLKSTQKIEFAVTNACTGRCKHCSEGAHCASGERIDPLVAADAVRKIAAVYDIKTVMAFGGEPLLYPEAVEKIMEAARELEVPKRQVITNGYFSNDEKRICEVARMLARVGVNDLLLSADAFHQESIPLGTVQIFAREAKRCGIPIRLSPAWLVSREDENPYNKKTREILAAFADMQIPVGEGNVVFPEGNALKFLSEYFIASRPENPYAEDAHDVKCISFSPNGAVLDGNVYEKDIMKIIKEYRPEE
jgi:hypothetical protein